MKATPLRKFLKLLAFGTATSVIAGKLWRREVLAFCENLPNQRDAVFKVRLSDFPALQQDYGSVRLGINPIVVDQNFEPYPDGFFWPFLINRDGMGNFFVLDCECRHASCVVPVYDNIEFVIRCPCHGSGYAIDGAVVNGPAFQPLHRYQSEFDGNDTLTVHIPCWGFSANLSVQPGGANSRIRLDFPTFPNVKYEVNFRERPQDAWATASFATSPTGLADQTSLIGTADEATVYLDRTTASGFYAVSMVLSEF